MEKVVSSERITKVSVQSSEIWEGCNLSDSIWKLATIPENALRTVSSITRHFGVSIYQTITQH